MVDMQSNKRIINKSLILLIGLNIALALISFLKDTLLASYLGTSGSADTLFATFFLPDAIGFNILGQTASLLLVPVFVSLLSDDNKKEALRTAYLVAFVFLLISLFSSLFFICGDSYTLIGIVSGRRNIDQNLAKTLMRVLVPIVFIIPMSYICIAYLNAQNRFKTTAIAPLIYNACILIAVTFCMLFKISVTKGIILISVAISSSALIMTIFLFYSAGVLKKMLSYRSCLAKTVGKTIRIKKLEYQMFYLIMIFTLYQSVLYFERFVAAKISLGGISALNYSYRLAQFPLWVFVAALLVILLPELSRQIASDNHEELYNKIYNAWLIVLLFITPVAVLMLILRREILSVVFLRGAFGQDSLELTSQIMAGYSISIIFQSLSYLLLRVYLVYGKMKKVLSAYLVSSVINVLFDFITYKYLGLWSIGIGAALGWLVNMICLLFMSENDFKTKILTKDKRTPMIIIVANVIASFAGFLMKTILETNLIFEAYTIKVLIVACSCCVIYLGVYLLILIKFKIYKRIVN